MAVVQLLWGVHHMFTPCCPGMTVLRSCSCSLVMVRKRALLNIRSVAASHLSDSMRGRHVGHQQPAQFRVPCTHPVAQLPMGLAHNSPTPPDPRTIAPAQGPLETVLVDSVLKLASNGDNRSLQQSQPSSPNDVESDGATLTTATVQTSVSVIANISAPAVQSQCVQFVMQQSSGVSTIPSVQSQGSSSLAEPNTVVTEKRVTFLFQEGSTLPTGSLHQSSHHSPSAATDASEAPSQNGLPTSSASAVKALNPLMETVAADSSLSEQVPVEANVSGEQIYANAQGCIPFSQLEEHVTVVPVLSSIEDDSASSTEDVQLALSFTVHTSGESAGDEEHGEEPAAIEESMLESDGVAKKMPSVSAAPDPSKVPLHVPASAAQSTMDGTSGLMQDDVDVLYLCIRVCCNYNTIGSLIARYKLAHDDAAGTEADHLSQIYGADSLLPFVPPSRRNQFGSILRGMLVENKLLPPSPPIPECSKMTKQQRSKTDDQTSEPLTTSAASGKSKRKQLDAKKVDEFSSSENDDSDVEPDLDHKDPLHAERTSNRPFMVMVSRMKDNYPDGVQYRLVTAKNLADWLQRVPMPEGLWFQPCLILIDRRMGEHRVQQTLTKYIDKHYRKLFCHACQSRSLCVGDLHAFRLRNGPVMKRLQ